MKQRIFLQGPTSALHDYLMHVKKAVDLFWSLLGFLENVSFCSSLTVFSVISCIITTLICTVHIQGRSPSYPLAQQVIVSFSRIYYLLMTCPCGHTGVCSMRGWKQVAKQTKSLPTALRSWRCGPRCPPCLKHTRFSL